MKGNSKPVFSSQSSIHERLDEVVQRHWVKEWQKPAAGHTCESFQSFLAAIAEKDCPLILDSGCGTGESTKRLAFEHPECRVIGIDKSAARMTKALQTLRPENALFFRADQFDFWRLSRMHGLRFKVHYLLYPNPWPKKAHLKRRIHAHPAFGELLAISERLILRSNWRIFVEEFAAAYRRITGREGVIDFINPRQPFTLFEKKYQESGHELYEFRG